MTSYLIEFRFFGSAKKEIKSLIWDVDHQFNLGKAKRVRPVPHITLVGPFKTRQQRRLVSDFKRLCSEQGIMRFKADGYGIFEDSKVVFINIRPDKALDNFRWELSKTLREYCHLKPYDLKREFKPHATIARKISPRKFEAVKKYVDSKPEPGFDHVVVRATLIKNSRILYEHDFLLKELLNRREAKSRRKLSETYYELRAGIMPPEEMEMGEIEENIFSKVINRFRKRRIFFISDLHLDHKRIIDYCKRPFETKKQMNKVIVENWNKTVNENDIVYFLGDMAFGRGSRKTSYWLKRLKGNIIFIIGSHDRSRKIRFYGRLILNYEGRKFLLVHDPKHIPEGWKDWVIHGHKHDNSPEYPLVNKKKKMINVSAELLDYRPWPLEELLKSI